MVEFEGARRALRIALTSAALVACGRTGLGSLWGGTSCSELTAVDFDQDGNQDLVLAHERGITLLFGAGDGTLACEAHYLVGSICDLRVGDLNGDRRMDIAATSSAGVHLFLSSAP